MATRKRSAAKKPAGSSRKLAVNKETLKDLTPQRPPKGGAVRKAPSVKVESLTCRSC
jgi:hypothetical protein